MAIDPSAGYSAAAVPAEANQKELEEIAGIFAGDTDYSVQKSQASTIVPKPTGAQQNVKAD